MDFASDNLAPAHPAILAALERANAGHAPPYGADAWTARASDRVRELVGPAAAVLFAFNGTGANVLCLDAATRPWEAVICAAAAHIDADEGGAPERLLGRKLLTVPTRDGKLRPDDVLARLGRVGDPHAVQPRVVSVSQSTELGTVYTPDELRALAEVAHAHGLVLHVDGARFANAVAALGCEPRALAADAGVDLLTFGGTKAGILLGEAVVVLAPALAEGIAFRHKQLLQLASKGRFLAAQFEALLADGLWLELAAHANAMARRLGEAVAPLPGVELTQPVQANAVFSRLPRRAIAPLQRAAAFNVWEDAGDVVRWMCAWDTRPQDVDLFAAAVAREVAERAA